MLRLFLSFILIAPLITSYAQKTLVEARVITQNNDTIKGLAEYSNWDVTPRSIKFTDSKGIIHEFNPTNIKGFEIPELSERYLSRRVLLDKTTSLLIDRNTGNRAKMGMDTVFLQLLVEGALSLYFLHDMNKVHYFVENSVDGIHELLYFGHLERKVNGEDNPAIGPETIKSLSEAGELRSINYYKGQLKYFLKGYPRIKSELELLSYDKRDLTAIITKFNNFIAPGKQLIVNTEKPMSYKLSVIAGFSDSFLRTNGVTPAWYLNNGHFPGSVKPIFGAGLNIISNRNFKQWSLYTELTYSALKTKISWHIPYTTPSKDSLTFNLSFLNLSAGPRFTMQKFKYNPFLTGGAVTSITMKRETIQRIPFEVLDYQFGFFGGAGIGFKAINLEYRFTILNGISPYLAIKSYMMSHYLTISYFIPGRKNK